MENKVAHLITAKTITVSINGKVYSVNAGNQALYDRVKELIRNKDFLAIPEAVDTLSTLRKQVAAQKPTVSGGKIVVEGRKVYYVEGDSVKQRLVGYEVTKLLEMLDQGFDVGPLSNFTMAVRRNPDEHVRGRLYEFMEYGNLPLAEDGSFIAYKVVGNDYLDKHSHSFDNHIGQTPTMPREQVDNNEYNTCSRGLHVCSKEYIQHFLYSNHDHLMVVKVQPENVVSIPVDYNNTKMRVSSYEVIGEVTEADDPAFFGKAVYQPKPVDDDAIDPELDGCGSTPPAKKGPCRDSYGHFTPCN